MSTLTDRVEAERRERAARRADKLRLAHCECRPWTIGTFRQGVWMIERHHHCERGIEEIRVADYMSGRAARVEA